MAVSVSRKGPNWAQLTYTSSDSLTGGPGGWGVKETSLGAAAAVLDVLRQHVTTRFDEVSPTSQFASDAELAARPRRLMSRELNGLSCLWHAVPAGLDATGRPGNVFTHAAATSPDAQLRPIAYWRSPDWLVPFGATEVPGARLGGLDAGAQLSRERVLGFIEPFERNLSLEWLLSGVAHGLRHGLTVVLGTEDPDEAAMWLGALAYLTSPGQARSLSWSTFDRAAHLSEFEHGGLDVVCVPRVDIEPLLARADPGLLILDPGWTLDASQPHGEVWTVQGQQFKVDPWQRAMTDLLGLAPAVRLAVLDAMDAIDVEWRDLAPKQVPIHLPLSLALLREERALSGVRAPRLVEFLRMAQERGFLLRPGVWSLVPRDSPDEVMWGALHQIPGFEQAVGIASDLEDAQAYLNGGWRTEQAPGQVQGPARELVRERLRAEAQSLAQKLRDLSASTDGKTAVPVDTQRLAASWLGAIWGPVALPIAAPVQQEAAVRLSDARQPGLHQDGVQWSMGSPLDGPLQLESGPPMAQDDAAAASDRAADIDKWLYPPSPAPAHLPPPDDGAAFEPDPEADPWSPVPAPSAVREVGAVLAPVPGSSGWARSADLERLARSLTDRYRRARDAARAAGDASLEARAQAYAECVLLTLGVRHVPLTSDQDADGDADLVASLVFGPTSHVAKGPLCEWLATYLALHDVARGLTEALRRQAADLLQAHPREVVEGLVGYLHAHDTDEPTLSRFIHICVFRVVHNKQFLGLSVPGTRDPVGITVLRRVAPTMPQTLWDAALDGAREQLGGFGNAVEVVESLRQTAPPRESSRRLRLGKER